MNEYCRQACGGCGADANKQPAADLQQRLQAVGVALEPLHSEPDANKVGVCHYCIRYSMQAACTPTSV